MAQGNTLHLYRQELRRKAYPFSCPHCKIKILPIKFEKHCLNVHKFPTKISCVWCLGREKWKSKTKYQNMKHLLTCFQKFIAVNGIGRETRLDSETDRSEEPSYRVPDVLKLMDTRPLCKAKSFFDHQDVREYITERAFEDVWLMDHGSEVEYFDDDNLNAAASYVRKYIQTQKTMEWFHVMVKAASFESFLKAVDEEEGRVVTLPFSCWCDGGPDEHPYFRQHRHMILVAPKGRFVKRIWSKVKPTKRPRKNYASKKYEQIESAMHLVNTMGYVSKRRSRCYFTIKGKRHKKAPLKNKHFYIFRTLPIDFRLPLTLQWDGGIEKAMDLEMFRKASAALLVQSQLVEENNGKYKQKIKHFHGFRGGLVLPLKREFVPTKNETSDFLYLMGGKKLYLGREDLNENWLKLQVERGNCFYEIVQEEMWTPPRRIQGFLKYAKPIVDTNRQLGSEKQSMQQQVADLQRDMAEDKNRIRVMGEDIVSLKRENENWKESEQALKRKLETTEKEMNKRHKKEMDEMAKCHERAMGELKKELEVVKKENGTLRKKNESLEKEVKELWKKVDRLKDKEIDRLNAENADLKAEIMRLRRENTQLKEHLAKYIKCNLKESSMET